MDTLECALGAIHLVLHEAVWQQMRTRKEQFARWPANPGELQAELNALARGVPAFWQDGRGKRQGQDQIVICTPSYHLLAVPSPQNDAYFVPWMDPLTLHQHDRLARGALLLRTTTWHVHAAYDTVPQGSRNDLDRVLRAWQALQAHAEAAPGPAGAPGPTHERYLNTLSQVVEVTRQLALDKAALAAPVRYRKVESAAGATHPPGEARRPTHDLYTFHLAPGSPLLNKGEFVRLGRDHEVRGRVHSVQDNRLAVKFEQAVDRASIPEQGTLEPSTSVLPYILQQQAIETLRAGEGKNRYLLPVLVDGVYQPYRPATAQPITRLNPAQVEAFHRSLAVPDLLLVLGPPGTGKTRTIAEIVRQHGADQRRVLVTAKTHKAVDNVLERLPAGLTVVRAGREERVSESNKHLLLEAQARKLQATVLERTEAHAQALSGLVANLEPIEQQAGRLPALIQAMEAAKARLRQARRQIEAEDAALRAHYEQEMENLEGALGRGRRRLARQEARLNELVRRQAGAQPGAESFPLDLVQRGVSAFLDRRIDRLRQEHRELQAAYDADARAYSQARTDMRRATRTAVYRRLLAHAAAAEQDHRSATRSVRDAALALDRMVEGLDPARPALAPYSAAALHRYLAWLHDSIPLLRSRQALLAEWRTRIETGSEELAPALIRAADVVGATCIGIATDGDFRSVDFDLVIADEAGQIGLPDLLVPLLRARRAMLVGDHQQLPPFVEDEVQKWLRRVSPEALPDVAWVDEEGTEADAVAELLTRSAFESLFPTADSAHVVRFDRQYRMPQAVADFAAERFYDNQLDTPEQEKRAGAPHADPLFKRPIALVDTSAVPAARRRESSPGRSGTDPEGWGMAGYLNKLEAELIARIAALYHGANLDWVVIVPYRAQARQVRRELSHLLPAAPDLNLDERVATVDSFQGGECDRVIYGFTRSNDQGRVGFLRELRRLNVAMTRAMGQLVLVGDVSTLIQSRDLPFRDTAEALVAHVRRSGELLSYEECETRLAAAAREAT